MSRFARRHAAHFDVQALGGIVLLAATVIAVAWANSPWAGVYQRLRLMRIGPRAWHLDLTVGAWAADGLLCVFFFVVGLELVGEMTHGSLRDPRRAAVPVAAAVGGMAAPALVYLGVLHARGAGALSHGWAIPTATDVAFALAALSVFGAGLPRGLRTFLLTLAVSDDVGAVLVIAAFYSQSVHPLPLVGAVASIVAFGFAARRRRARWWVLALLALLAWYLARASGVHPTIGAVGLGLATPSRALPGELEGRSERWRRAFSPLSALVAAPIFAFFAAGVPVGGHLGAVARDPVFQAVVAGLVFGKPLGVLATTTLLTRLTPLRLPAGISVRDLLPVGMLTGIGFTVALLVTSLSFDAAAHADSARAGILAGSALSALAGAALAQRDVRRGRGIEGGGGIARRPGSSSGL